MNKIRVLFQVLVEFYLQQGNVIEVKNCTTPFFFFDEKDYTTLRIKEHTLKY